MHTPLTHPQIDAAQSPPDDPFARLRDLALLRGEVDKMLAHEGLALHDAEGHSWTDVGNALGITRQAAWERFTRNADAEWQRLARAKS